jgi:hypothetical protein
VAPLPLLPGWPATRTAFELTRFKRALDIQLIPVIPFVPYLCFLSLCLCFVPMSRCDK